MMWGKGKGLTYLTDDMKKGSTVRANISLRKIVLVSILLALVFWIVIKVRRNRSYEAFDVNKLPRVHFPSPEIVGLVPSDFQAAWFCDVLCKVGQPCEYKDEVDFRVIVMTFNRPWSLEKCLKAISHLDTLGDSVSVEIWIDRNKNGSIDIGTVKTAENFVKEWNEKDTKRRACVHRQARNAYIGGQWIDTWRPKENTQELGLILEDDVSISPHAYRWIKAAHGQYGGRTDVAGYTLQMEGTNFFAPLGKFRPMNVSSQEVAFMYPVIGTWGYAPHPRAWRTFQEWYHTVRPHLDIKNDYISPRVPGMEADNWYGYFLRDGRQESMWEMWHIRFTYDAKLFTLYSNMRQVLGRKDVVLSSNRMENGLHYSGSGTDNTKNLLSVWDPKFVDFPARILQLNYDGTKCTEECYFQTECKN